MDGQVPHVRGVAMNLLTTRSVVVKARRRAAGPVSPGPNDRGYKTRNRGTMGSSSRRK